MTSRQARVQEETHFRIMRILQDNLFVTTDDRLLKRCQKAIPALNAQRPAEALATSMGRVATHAHTQDATTS